MLGHKHASIDMPGLLKAHAAVYLANTSPSNVAGAVGCNIFQQWNHVSIHMSLVKKNLWLHKNGMLWTKSRVNEADNGHTQTGYVKE